MFTDRGKHFNFNEIFADRLLEDKQQSKFGVQVILCHYVKFVINFDGIRGITNKSQAKIWKNGTKLQKCEGSVLNEILKKKEIIHVCF